MLPQHPSSAQLRAADLRRGGRGRRAAVRAQDQRHDEARKANEEAFARAVQAVTDVSTRLLEELVTTAPPRSREREIARARERNAVRFGPRTA